MHIQITGHRVDVTQAMQQYVNEKFAKLDQYLTHFDDDQKKAHVTVKHMPSPAIKVNFSMHLPKHAHIFAEKTGGDFYGTVDLLLHAVEQELRRYKRKLTDPDPRHTPTFRG